MSADRPDGSDEAELLRALFLEEALSHLAEIVEAQQALAAATEEGERLLAVDAMLRHLHTLKGAAGSVGFESIGRSAHDIEELCAEIRAGSLAPTAGILDRIDEALGGLRALLDGARDAPAGGQQRPAGPHPAAMPAATAAIAGACATAGAASSGARAAIAACGWTRFGWTRCRTAWAIW